MNLMSAVSALSASNHDNDGAAASNKNQPGSDSLQNNFLTMLTAELRSQDPMNPMDSTQMVTQLSQISTSQGIADLKKLSQSEIMALLGQQRLSSSQLIGKDVSYQVNSLNVDGDHGQFSGSAKPTSGGAGDIKITIKDQNGNVVRTMKVAKGSDGDYDWKWDGKDNDHKVVAKGAYSVSASTDDGDAEVLLSNKVKQVDFDANGETKLIFNDGQSTNISNVTSIGDSVSV